MRECRRTAASDHDKAVPARLDPRKAAECRAQLLLLIPLNGFPAYHLHPSSTLAITPNDGRSSVTNACQQPAGAHSQNLQGAILARCHKPLLSRGLPPTP